MATSVQRDRFLTSPPGPSQFTLRPIRRLVCWTLSVRNAGRLCDFVRIEEMIGLYASWSVLSAAKDFRIAAGRTHVQVVMRK